MQIRCFSRLITLAVIAATGFSEFACAAINVSGEVFPAHNDAEPWGITDELTVGDTASGALTISGGSQTTTGKSFLGAETGSTGSASVEGQGSSWTALQLHVGYYGDGELSVSAGGFVLSDETRLGWKPGSTSRLTVTGQQSELHTNELVLGWLSERAELTVEDGGYLLTVITEIGYWTTGTASVVGAGSHWESIGEYFSVGRSSGGHGELLISEGGLLSARNSTIGANAESTGEVLVQGQGSSWKITRDLEVGLNGRGTLTLQDGGQLESLVTYIGDNRDSHGMVTLDGSGSVWRNGSGISVGRYGSGSVTLANGARLETRMIVLGNNYGASGAVTVSGADTELWSDEKMKIGIKGEGRLRIEDGGLVAVGGLLTIDEQYDPDSSIRIKTGGRLALKGNTAESLSLYQSQIAGMGGIEYWADSAWRDLDLAEPGVDYQLRYIDSGTLAGYTVLTVGIAVPEGRTITIAALACAICFAACRPRATAPHVAFRC